jgi:CheY-like chemotaxis protein
MKILVVDDEALVAMSLEFLLKVEGHLITGLAHDVASATSSADTSPPELAFIDIELARGVSGFDAAAALRERGILCFFLTGNIPSVPRPDLALGCIPKPCTDDVIQAALKIAAARLAGSETVTDVPGDLILY